MPADDHDPGPGPVPGTPPVPFGPALARRAAEPLAWWVALLVLYLVLVSTVSITEITVGALSAAAGAAAAAAAGRVLLTADTTRGPAGRAPVPRPVPAVRLAPALALLPGQVAADTARITVRGASGGDWAPLPVASAPADRAAATLLMSVSPGTYVGGVDPERGLLRVHRLTPGPSPFERSLRRSGLIGGQDAVGRDTEAGGRP